MLAWSNYTDSAVCCQSIFAGTGGTVKINAFWFCEDGFTIIKNGQEEFVSVDESRPLYAVEADAFAASVLDGAAPWMTKEDTLGNMRAMDELRASAGVPVE